MRVRRLVLDRFGHFAGKTFDFGEAGTASDFHIVYGPNEAGKTTTMEAFLRLLYGFGGRETYGFRHQRKNLSLTADLDLDSGPRRVVRLPKGLFDETGTAIPETVVTGALGGLDQKQYRDLLCLDDATIERGGEEILRAQGDIGRLLFAAAAGIGTVTALLDSVRDEADALYRRHARKTVLAQLGADLRDIDAQIRQVDVGASAFRALRKALNRARTDEDEARAALDAAQARVDELTARRAVLPDLAEIYRLTDFVADHAAWPEYLDIEPDRLIDLQTRLATCLSDLSKLDAEITTTTNALASISADPDRAALYEALDALEPLHRRYITASQDLPKRLRGAQDLETELAEAAAALGISNQDPRQLILSAQTLATLDEASKAVAQARLAQVKAQDEARHALQAKAEAELALARAKSDLPNPQGIAALLQASEIDQLAPAFAAAEQALASATDQYETALDALALSGQGATHLSECPFHEADIKALQTTLSIAETRHAAACDTATKLRADLAATEAQIASLHKSSGVVDDHEALRLKQARAAAWEAHRETLSLPTADTFELTLEAHDAAQEARLSQAGALGALRSLETMQAEQAARLDVAQATGDDAMKGLQEARKAISGAARQLGLPETSAVEVVLDRVQAHAEAARAKSALERCKARHATTLSRARDLHDDLAQRLGKPHATFASLIETARQSASTETAALASLDRAKERLQTAEDAWVMRKTAAQLTEDAFGQAMQDWREAVAALSGGALADLDPDTPLDALYALREIDGRAQGLTRQIDAMQADQVQYKTSLASTAARFEIEPSDIPLSTHRALSTRLAQADEKQAKIDGLTDALARSTTAHNAARDRYTALETEITTILALFDGLAETDTPNAARAALTKAASVIADRKTLKTLRARVLHNLGLEDFEQAQADLSTQSEAIVDAHLTDARMARDAARIRLSDASEARVNAQRDLDAVGADATVADLTERRTTLVLEIEAQARRYLQLEAAHRLAFEAIRRFRDTHRSGMMAATERIFEMLTDGAYPKLGVETDGGADRLLAFDRFGASKEADDMSKGTRFQLFLALRAAAYEQLATQGRRLPFFCDDVFETFDEDRTRAALRVMEQIGQHGQAIYLTHHRHVVDLAKDVCKSPPAIHDITRDDARLDIPDAPLA